MLCTRGAFIFVRPLLLVVVESFVVVLEVIHSEYRGGLGWGVSDFAVINKNLWWFLHII